MNIISSKVRINDDFRESIPNFRDAIKGELIKGIAKELENSEIINVDEDPKKPMDYFRETEYSTEILLISFPEFLSIIKILNEFNESPDLPDRLRSSLRELNKLLS